MGFRTSRKTTSSVRSFCRHLKHSPGCVRGKSRKPEGTSHTPRLTSKRDMAATYCGPNVGTNAQAEDYSKAFLRSHSGRPRRGIVSGKRASGSVASGRIEPMYSFNLNQLGADFKLFRREPI